MLAVVEHELAELRLPAYFAAATEAALVLAAFRAPYRGRSTPVNAWWGSFDLAVNLFSGTPAAPPAEDFIMRNAMDAEEVAVGWWPGDARYGRAAYYAYAHPAPPGLADAALEPAAHLVGVVAGVLIVLVERDGPRHLLRRRVDLHRAAEIADRRDQFARDGADRAVGHQRDGSRAAVAVLHERLVMAQIEGGDDRPGAVGRRQRRGLPAARGQPQRGVLQLWLLGRQRHCELAEHLRVRVQRVARRVPLLIRREPCGRV